MIEHVENMPAEVKKEVIWCLGQIASSSGSMMIEGVNINEMAKGALLLIAEMQREIAESKKPPA